MHHSLPLPAPLLPILTVSIASLLPIGCEQGGEPEQTADYDGVTTDELKPFEVSGIKNVHTYQGIFLASQPDLNALNQAKEGGVETVINMRHPDELEAFDEAEVVTELGVDYHNPAWNGPEELTDEVFDEYRNLLNTEERPILLHCSSANRVGAIWLAYRALDDGLDVDEALAEAKTVGLKSSDYEAKAKEYVAGHKR